MCLLKKAMPVACRSSGTSAHTFLPVSHLEIDFVTDLPNSQGCTAILVSIDLLRDVSDQSELLLSPLTLREKRIELSEAGQTSRRP